MEPAGCYLIKPATGKGLMTVLRGMIADLTGLRRAAHAKR